MPSIESKNNEVMQTDESEIKKKKKKSKKNKNKVKSNESNEEIPVNGVNGINGDALLNWEEVRSSLLSDYEFVSSVLKFAPSAPKFNPNEHIASSKRDKKRKRKDSVDSDDSDDDNNDDKPGTSSITVNGEQKKKSKIDRVQTYEELRQRWTEKLNSLTKNRKKSFKSNADKREERALKKKLSNLEKKKKNKNNLKGNNQKNVTDIKEEKGQ